MSRAAREPSRGSELPTAVLLSTFVRSLLVQGSWNYRSMLGTGFAFALLPVLRSVHPPGEERRKAVDRHVEHFNAHPYLAPMALGSVARLEAEEVDPAVLRKLKIALRGPLGSLGDALIWATVLPGVAVGALALLWLGVPVWLALGLFLFVFNAVHLGIRAWGFRAGLEAGRDVGRVLARADLSGWTRRLEPWLVVLLGFLAGAVIGGRGGLLDAGPLWVVLAGAGFLAGLVGGHRAWRPAAALTVGAIVVLVLFGAVS